MLYLIQRRWGLIPCYVLHCSSPNADSLLKETYDSLKDQAEVWVVENGVTTDYPNRIHLSANLGVSRGYNAGLRHFIGLGTGHDFALICNNDILASPTMVQELVKTGPGEDSIGIVSPRIYYYGSRRIWFDGGSFNSWTGVSRHEGIRKIGARPKLKETEWVSGCCLLIKREVIEKVGYFDEAYSPAYSEDIDYSMRVREAGYKLVVNPNAILWHKVSCSTSILEG